MTAQATENVNVVFKTMASIPSWTMRQMSELSKLDPSNVMQHFSPGAVISATAGAGTRAMQGMRLSTSPPAAGAAFTEIKNKGEVYLLVRQNKRILDIPSPSPHPFPIETYLDRAYEREDYPALWAVEGLGHLFGESQLDANETSADTNLLGGSESEGIPLKSLLMLHAGIGLAYAQRLLGKLKSQPTDDEVLEATRQIFDLCRQNSRPAYLGAAVESLGLVTRTFESKLLPQVDRAVDELEPEWRGYFWHGVGRALYFLPLNFLPCSTWEVVEMAARESVDDISRHNLYAGAGWAMAMVNLRNPNVLADLVIKPHGEKLLSNLWFQNGIASALVMREDTTPDTPLIGSFLKESEKWKDPELQSRWETIVIKPSRKALDTTGPELLESGQIGRIFEYSELL